MFERRVAGGCPPSVALRRRGDTGADGGSRTALTVRRPVPDGCQRSV